MEKCFLCNSHYSIYYLSQWLMIINTSFLKIYSKLLISQQSHFLRVWVLFVVCLQEESSNLFMTGFTDAKAIF